MKIKDLIQTLQDKYVSNIDSVQSKEEAAALLKEAIESLKETFKNYQVVKRPPRKTDRSRVI